MAKKWITRKLLINSAAVLIVVSATTTWFVANRNSNTNQVFGPAPVVTVSVTTPEEQLPAAVGYIWQGQITDPKHITIKRIDVDSIIQNVGVDQNTAIAVPNNIHIAGWFVDSVRPGEKGLSIIDGHVNGPTVKAGVFGRLSELVVGDKAQVVLGDGTKFEYKVISTQDLPVDKSADALFSQDPSIIRQLNLITCTGEYDKQNQTYKNRYLVTLEQL